MKKRFGKYLENGWKAITKQELSVLPGNIAFNIVLAFFPFLILIVLIASCFSIDIETINNLIKDLLPASSSELVIDVISGKGFDKNVGVFAIIGLLVASNGTFSLITASNMLYKVKKGDVIKDRIKAIIILFIILVLFIFLIIVPLFGERILNLIAKTPTFNSIIDNLMVIFKILQWPISVIIVYFNIKLIYAIAPSISIESKTTSYGAMFTTIIWIISTFVFKYYLLHFAKYDIIYGNLSSIIVLMIWIYLLSFVFVLGMAINVVRYEQKEE